MTITAVLPSLAFLVPSMLFVGIALWLAVAWSRIASAHHYPTDVLGGTALALAVSIPVSQYTMSVLSSIL